MIASFLAFLPCATLARPKLRRNRRSARGTVTSTEEGPMEGVLVTAKKNWFHDRDYRGQRCAKGAISFLPRN